MDIDHEVVETGVLKPGNDMLQQRHSADRHEGLGDGVRDRFEAGT